MGGAEQRESREHFVVLRAAVDAGNWDGRAIWIADSCSAAGI